MIIDFPKLIEESKTQISSNIIEKYKSLQNLLIVFTKKQNITDGTILVGLEKEVLRLHLDSFISIKLFGDVSIWSDDFGNEPDFDYLDNIISSELIFARLTKTHSVPGSINELLRIADLVSFGEVSSIRKGKAKSTKDNQNRFIEFPDPKQVDRSLPCLLSSQWISDWPWLASEVHRYLSFILLHPLPDCNKRVARMMLNIHSSRILEIKVPILPIGPYIHCNLVEYRMLLRSYIWHNNVDGIMLFFLRAIIDTIAKISAIFEAKL